MKLEILLGLVSLVLSPLGGEANIQVHKNVLLHGSLRMSYSPSQKIGASKSIIWKFDKINEQVTILDTTEKPHYVYASKFRDRLQPSENLHTLTIVDLTMEDGGMYTIDVVDLNGVRESYSFNVTVYEPVPLPSIRTEVKENTKDTCNVTLHCSVPSNTSDFSYSWQCGDRKSDCQQYNNGRTVQISLKNDSKDMEILCIVQNPVDKKNVSFHVQKMCTFTDKTLAPRSHFTLIIIVVVIVTAMVPIISVMCIKMKCGNKKAEPTESRNTEMHYIEVTTRQREDNQRVQMENDHYIGMPSPKRTKAETLYTTLQHPPPSYT
ncbi:CD48 antigen-like isoform X1 [Bufo gargarizans]|uniref:CD48 antigen-like isoform X1 n=1 Tax=Bufo gargarizans TaxID=30331 RepID=UPI001CF31E4D|nr:CD48 antigen-like isoform X1 [Bufo gargarizans]